jgi:O-antigen/teichoic acid export membrane protein
VWVIVASTAVSVVFTYGTLDQLFGGDPVYLPITALLILAYGGFALGRGFLAGRGRYRQHGLSTLTESVLRLLLAITLLAAGAGAPGLAWSLVAGALVVWLWRPFHGERLLEAGKTRERGTGAALARFVTANGASQTILAAGPLVVGALGAPPAEVSVFFETTLLFRAPLTVSYNLISRVLPPFTRIVDRGEEATLRRWALRIGIGGAVLAALAYAAGLAAGPGVVELLLGAEFRPTAELAALAASGMALATVALFAQQMLIAMQATTMLAGAWLVGLLVAASMVWLGGPDASLRVGRAFLSGEAVAFAGITAAVTMRRS